MVQGAIKRMAQVPIVGCAALITTMATLVYVQVQFKPTDLLYWGQNYHIRAHMVPQSVEGTASFDDTSVLHNPIAPDNLSVVWLADDQYQTLQSGSSVMPFPRQGCPQRRGVLLMSGNRGQLCDQGFTLILSNWHRLGNGLLSIANMLHVAEQTFRAQDLKAWTTPLLCCWQATGQMQRFTTFETSQLMSHVVMLPSSKHSLIGRGHKSHTVGVWVSILSTSPL